MEKKSTSITSLIGFNLFKTKLRMSAILTIISLLLIIPVQVKAFIVGVYGTTIEVVDENTFASISTATLTMPGYTILEGTTVTWNSDNTLYYAVVAVDSTPYNGNPTRLVTVNPFTGLCSDIGFLGDDFATLTYNSLSGVMYGMQGSALVPSERGALYTIDVGTAAKTNVGVFGYEDIHVIAYSYTDGMIYHWSGNVNTTGVLLQKINTSTYTATGIPLLGAAYLEVTGAVYYGTGVFLVTEITSYTPLTPKIAAVSTNGFNTEVAVIPNVTRGLGFNNPVLPVELTSFVHSISGNTVSLNWTTSSEINNSGFEIQRAEINAGAEITWVKAGFIAGKGTAGNYFFADKNLNTGRYNYRLKQVDFNGNFEYFNLSSEVNIGIPEMFTLSQNYPNPFNPTTKIDFNLPLDGNVNLFVFDNTGRQIAELVNEYKPAGFYSVNFNASSFSSGVYYYEMISGNFSSVKKMIILK